MPWRPEDINAIIFRPAYKTPLCPERPGKHLFLRYTHNHITKIRIVLYQGSVRIQKPPTPLWNEFTKEGVSISADTSRRLGQGPGINCDPHVPEPLTSISSS